MLNLRHTVVEIDQSALINNYQQLRRCLPENGVLCGMVKANAYGHGLLPVARCLQSQGIDAFGVSLVEEGIALREAGITAPIWVFASFDLPAMQAVCAHGLTPVIGSWQEILYLAESTDKPYGYHIDIDTGMGRLGFSPEELKAVWAQRQDYPQLKLEALSTHLAYSADLSDPEGSSHKQLLCLENLLKELPDKPPLLHLPNTAGLLGLLTATPSLRKRFPTLWSVAKLGGRPGIGLYGLDPTLDALQPVMRLKSQLSRIYRLPAGEALSYDHTWRAERDSVIGVVPIGYGDGYPRELSNRTEVIVAGQHCPQVGTICMDYLMVDLTDVADHPDCQLNAVVSLWGDPKQGELSVMTLADQLHTIPYTLVTQISARVPRQLV